MKKVVTLFTLSLINLGSVLAQGNSLSGVILDTQTQSPIEYANVLVLTNDSSYLQGCITDKKGEFVLTDLPDKAEWMRVSFVGYADTLYNVAKLNARQCNTLYLRPSAISLKGVTVVGKSKPFAVNDEGIVFNPSFVSYATNASDIIRQAPGVMDTGTSLVMPGKDAIKIYIDGKEQKGSLNDILLLLKSYHSSDVESVEVMQNPSARYTKGQNVGILNIKLKKKADDFLGANAAYAFAYDTQVRNEGSVGVFYQGKKLATSLTATGNWGKSDLNEKNVIDFADYSRQAVSDMTRNNDNVVLRWNLDYQANPDWEFGLSTYYSNGKMKQRSDQRYDYSFEDGRSETELIDGIRTDKSDTYFASFNVGGKLSKIADLTANVDYYHKASPTERLLTSIPDSETLVSSLDDIASDNTTANVNVGIRPNSKLSMNVGIDGIFTSSKSKARGAYEDGGTVQDNFTYTENEVDLYGEARYKFNPRWMLRGSLRYQSLWTEAKTETASATSRHFDVLCPSAYLSFLPDDNQSLQLGFYYNINRPTLTAVNPTRLYAGNDTYRQGNPNLKHSKHYVVNFSYSLGSLLVQPYIEWLDDGITEISELIDNRYQKVTWENAVDRRNIGLMIFYSFNKLKWMRASATSFLSNVLTTSEHPLLLARKSSVKFSINPNLQFFLDNDKNWILAFYGNYSTPERTVDGYLDSAWKLDAGLTWKAGKKWILSATGQNLLHSHLRGTQYIGDSVMKFNNKFFYTGFQLSVSYVWGKSMRRTMDKKVLMDMNTRTELD